MTTTEKSPIIKFMNTDLLDIHISNIDEYVFNGTFADNNSEPTTVITFDLSDRNLTIGSTSYSTYGELSYIDGDYAGTLFSTILRWLSEHDAATTLFSDFVKDILHDINTGISGNLTIASNLQKEDVTCLLPVLNEMSYDTRRDLIYKRIRSDYSRDAQLEMPITPHDFLETYPSHDDVISMIDTSNDNKLILAAYSWDILDNFSRFETQTPN